jgi:hypothetical protein
MCTIFYIAPTSLDALSLPSLFLKKTCYQLPEDGEIPVTMPKHIGAMYMIVQINDRTVHLLALCELFTTSACCKFYTRSTVYCTQILSSAYFT